MNWFTNTFVDIDGEAVSLVDTRPIVGVCDECGNDIHGPDAPFVSDRYYLLDDGTLLCSDECLISFFKEKLIG